MSRRACRLVNAESDGLPGLVVDAYGPWLVVQALTLGIATRLPELVPLMLEAFSPPSAWRGVYERSDVDVRSKEGLPEASGVLWGEAPPQLVEVDEPGADGEALRFLVDIAHGHKTGWYLDQRENRRRVAPWCRNGDVLNLFSYSGGFGVHALAAGARSIEHVDSSAAALDLARRNTALNELTQEASALVGASTFVEADVFSLLRRYRDAGRRFDLIICDPPKLVFHAGQLESATRAYKDVNRLAMGLLRSGGILATFSCSGLVSADLFQKVLFGASVDAGKSVDILDVLTQAPDHPVRLSFPEGAYLKGLVCRVE